LEGGSDAYAVTVATDCRDAPSTRCVLKVGEPYYGRFLWVFDRDRFAVTLDRSKRYTFSLVLPSKYVGEVLVLLDGRGRQLIQAADNGPDGKDAYIRGFRPASSGKHYLAAFSLAEPGTGYRLLAAVE